MFLEMPKEHTMYELRISSVGKSYILQASDSGRVDGNWEYGSFEDLSTRLSDLGIDRSELVIPGARPGEPQAILSNYRFRGSVLSEVLGISQSR
jgi:hypothetical protein